MKAKIFAFLEVSFLLGALCAPLFNNETQTWLILGLVLTVLSLIILKINKYWFVILCFGLFFLSISKFYQWDENLLFLNKQYSGKNVKYIGTVIDMPVEKEYSQKLVISLDRIDKKVILYTDKKSIKYGEKIFFEGKLEPYSKNKTYLEKEGAIGQIYVKKIEIIGKNDSLPVLLKGKLFFFREQINNALKAALPQAESGLASGLILGEKQFLTADFTRALQGSGTSHIIALSGYNITVIIGLFALLGPYFSRRLNLIIPIIFIIIFVMMTGGAASVVRASIMGMMPLFARFLGRQTDSLLAILFSAFVMVCINPFLLLYDVGFQLSFAALCGMIYIGPFVKKIFTIFPETIGKIFSETIGAQIGVLPLILFYFGYVSIISPVSNLLILSLVPLAMLFSMLVGMIQLALPWLNTILVFPAYFILHGIILLIEFFGSLPFATYKQAVDEPYIIILVYLFMIDIVFLLRSKIRSVLLEKEYF